MFSLYTFHFYFFHFITQPRALVSHCLTSSHNPISFQFLSLPFALSFFTGLSVFSSSSTIRDHQGDRQGLG
ncbi:hypothetical protein RchiOBHm_Chr7g0208611 [Rosa chinensis]|uniref:Uncharacterized protein n=1 Tax=Rosa chinensis TaxID=74649 RepID=A0A2P6P9R0_ROSCH|nr:hypothetical protein RchiOBHm_Chr7g0208611 [Rosa chinensis]